jgi:Bicoid-interacting protein 3 (Bin3)
MEIPNRDEKLIRCLVNLFNEIDLNGNGILEWEEFQNYVIEKATVLNNIKSKTDEIKNYTKAFIKPLDSLGMAKKFNLPITKVKYISSMDRIAFYEE